MKLRVTLILLLAMSFFNEIIAQQQISLPVNLPKAGKVAFLWEGEKNASQAEKNAKDFFVAYMGDKGDVITSVDNKSKDKYDCIWVHIEREMGKGKDNLPDFFLSVANPINNFIQYGGNVYLSGFAVYLVNKTGRCDYEPNIFPNDSEGNHEVNYYINTIFPNKTDYSQHQIYSGLDPIDGKPGCYTIYKAEKGYSNYCYWDFANYSFSDVGIDGITDFENKTKSKVLGSIDNPNNQDYNESAGIVEFFPTSVEFYDFDGAIITNGLAQWATVPGYPNEYQDNLYRLTANILSYLCPGQASEEVKVEALNLKDNKFAVEFQVSDDDIVIPLAISFNQEINPSDFDINVKPYNNAEGWKTLPENLDIEEAYQAALNHSALFDEYRAMGGEKAKIDGFYNGAENFTGRLEKATDHEGYNYVSYDIHIPGIPCSGRYILSITPSESLNFNDAEHKLSDITLDIYPNLFGEFGTAGIRYEYTDASEETQTLTSVTNKGFNINGYTFDKPDIDFAIINIPSNFENLANAVGYTPGIYFASELVHDTGASNAPSRREKRGADNAAEGDSHPYFIPIDLSDLNSTSGAGQVDLKIKVTKNDASKTFNFAVKTDDQNVNTSTVVDEISSGNDNSQPIFYNLQGMQVKSPVRGIFIKVEGGKSSKVVL